jgi:hypothetical protein
MSDDRSRRAPDDLYIVTLTETWEVEYWSDRFGVPPDDLHRAVAAVGNRTEDVERYIRQHIRQAMKEADAEGD